MHILSHQSWLSVSASRACAIDKSLNEALVGLDSVISPLTASPVRPLCHVSMVLISRFAALVSTHLRITQYEVSPLIYYLGFHLVTLELSVEHCRIM